METRSLVTDGGADSERCCGAAPATLVPDRLRSGRCSRSLSAAWRRVWLPAWPTGDGRGQGCALGRPRAIYTMPPAVGSCRAYVLYIAGWLGLPSVRGPRTRLGIPRRPRRDRGRVRPPRSTLIRSSALTLGLVIFGEYTLIVRSAMLETLGED
jgi:hypothetical protein